MCYICSALARAAGPLSHFVMVDSSCHYGYQVTSYVVGPVWYVISCICLGWNPCLMHAMICSCVSISGLYSFDYVCGLVIEVSMVLDFKYVVWGVYCFTRRHIGVRFVCRFLFFGRASTQADVRGD